MPRRSPMHLRRACTCGTHEEEISIDNRTDLDTTVWSSPVNDDRCTISAITAGCRVQSGGWHPIRNLLFLLAWPIIYLNLDCYHAIVMAICFFWSTLATETKRFHFDFWFVGGPKGLILQSRPSMIGTMAMIIWARIIYGTTLDLMWNLSIHDLVFVLGKAWLFFPLSFCFGGLWLPFPAKRRKESYDKTFESTIRYLQFL